METKANSAMIPDWLPMEHRTEFLDRINRAFQRARIKYGSEPGYRTRQAIIGGLSKAYKYGLVGNREWGVSVKQIRVNRARWRAVRERDGDCKGEVARIQELGKKRKQQRLLEERKANRVVQDKRSFLEF